MDSFEVTVDADGRLTLPQDVMRRVGARPGDQVNVAETGARVISAGDGLSLRLIVTGRESKTHATRESGAHDDDLRALKVIARQARADGAKTSSAVDPIGDYLLEDDRRSRGL